MTKHRLPYFLAALAFVLVGCSYTCEFEARGAVRDAATGNLIAGATVELRNAAGHPIAGPVSTSAQGAFQFDFAEVPRFKREITGWSLVVEAAGFEPETIAVGPVREPEGDEKTYLIFQVAMRQSP